MKEVTGNLIELAKSGHFDAIGHGCNCFCRMKRGIAPLMAEAFGCDKHPLENAIYAGDYHKLGRIDGKVVSSYTNLMMVFNMYTQYHWTESGPSGIPLDYVALRLCLRKLNMQFSGQKIGLPRIGCGLAGGDWNYVKAMMEEELRSCDLTVVFPG